MLKLCICRHIHQWCGSISCVCVCVVFSAGGYADSAECVGSGRYVTIGKHFGLVYLFWRVLEGNKTIPKVAETASITRGDSLLAFHSKHKSFGTLLAGASVASNREVPSWSCSKAVYKPLRHKPLLSVQWINSWWWTMELPETCRVSWQNKFVKFVHLVGFIIKKFCNDAARSHERKILNVVLRCWYSLLRLFYTLEM